MFSVTINKNDVGFRLENDKQNKKINACYMVLTIKIQPQTTLKITNVTLKLAVIGVFSVFFRLYDILINVLHAIRCESDAPLTV